MNVRGPYKPMRPAPTEVDTAPSHINIVGGELWVVGVRVANRRANNCVSEMNPAVTASTAANHTGLVHHHAAVRRSGVHTPNASSAPHSERAVRCHAYTPAESLLTAATSLFALFARRSSDRAQHINTPTCTHAATAVNNVGGVVFDRLLGIASINAAR